MPTIHNDRLSSGTTELPFLGIRFEEQKSRSSLPLREKVSRIFRERKCLSVTLVTTEADSEGVFPIYPSLTHGAAAARRPFVCPVTVHLLCLGHLFSLISADGFYCGGDPPQEPETNPESSALSSSTLVLPSIPETPDPILDGSDEEEEHPEAQAQALRATR
ncbi:hypothetical protein M9H77_18560 [Catharanthus roseus]|uniref:Uncharacterized protein n=1 Tax=Catharanthus roseus TaxID=4058 RepID=A0ACC0B7Y3_CATRO|nr:hypothetical protein M9H77_18560 [Catharanthus roseus]